MNQISPKKVCGFAFFLFSLVLCLFLAACGGSASSGGGTPSGGGFNPCTPYSATPPSAHNVVNVSIDCAVFGAVNEPFISVTLCEPSNTSNCLTVDHILVDTGSTGLRIFAAPSTTAALSTLNLPAQTSGGNPVGECLQFVQGNIWGPIRLADIRVGGETANNAAIQVINDSSFSTVPDACTSSGTVISTPAAFGANGVIGVGVILQDCGSYCINQANQANVYFSCTSSGCSNIGMPVADQIQNPVSLFTATGDTNGVILSLNSIPASGAASTGGTLTFGIDTASNNVSSNANTILVDSNYGVFTTTFEGQTYDNSYIDSGSNGLYFSPASNETITQCSGYSAGFYCPALTLNFNAQMIGLTGSTATTTVNFSVTSANILFNTNNAAFTTLAGTATDVPGIGKTFDWGLPFFYGKNVYVAFEGAQTTKGTGPYFGF